MSALLKIRRASPMLTVQDRGRRGLLHAGVSGSGPMDPPAFALANALVGNGPGAAGLEFAGFGGTFEVTAPVRIAVTGGEAQLSRDGAALAPWESHELAPGQVLGVGALKDAVWGYLAVSGGIETPPVLGARATHLRTGLGGHEGRALREGDDLPLGETAVGPCLRLRSPLPRGTGPIRVVPGPQDDFFDEAAWAAFAGGSFTVSATRDRMATALEGQEIRAAKGHDIVSDGTPLGSVQVPGSGRPIVLMAERQTTGGYPKIATVASADLPRLAQTPSGGALSFTRVSREEAEEAALAARRALARAIDTLAPKGSLQLSSEYLLSVNLIDGVVGPEAAEP